MILIVAVLAAAIVITALTIAAIITSPDADQ